MVRPFIPISFLALSWAVTSQDIFQALTDAGAGRFANFIQSNPTLKATYTSGRVRNVFAPSDLYFVGKRADTTTADEQKALLAASDEEGDIRSYRTLPGKKVRTLDQSANLAGLAQTVVTDARANAAGTSRRSNLAMRQGTSLFQIASGLGNKVNVIKGDIPYTGGLIHITDGSFTVPQQLSDTAQLTGQTIFANLMSSANLTDSLNNAPLTTFFIPSNAALAAAGLSNPGPDTAAMLAEHVVPNFAAYLPDLQNGLALPNQNGRALTISVKDGEYFVGDAKIVQANQILANGVAYVIDGVLGTPGTATSSNAPTGASGAATSSSAPTGTPGAATGSSTPTGTPGAATSSSAPTKTLETVTTGSAPTTTPTTVTVNSAPTINTIKDVRSLLMISVAMAVFYLMI